MKLSISNIAWPNETDELYLKNIRGWGCSGIEIAPGRLWQKPLMLNSQERKSFKSQLDKYGLEISAMHALLYNHDDLGIFRDPQAVAETVKYLKGLCYLAADLGISVLVFGSPRNRRRDSLPLQEAFEKAADFFSKIAPTAEELGICICIEPLRPQETDFITTAAEGLRLVQMVNSPGFKLHLDATAIAEEGEDFLEVFRSAVPNLRHFHISEPGLTEINSTGSVDHIAIARALRDAGYRGYVSIEMRTAADYDNAIKRSIQFSRNTYIDFQFSESRGGR